jgi:hypothetical protein
VFDVLPLRDADGRDWWVYADPYHGLPTRTRHPERSLYLADGTEVLVSVGYVRYPRGIRGGRGGPGEKVSPQDRGVPGGRPPGPAQRRSAWWPAPRRGEATARSWPARWG